MSGTCPTCGGWAKKALREVLSGDTTYECAKGHKWTLEAEALVVARPVPNVHDFELVPTTVYVTGPMSPLDGNSSFPSLEAATHQLRQFGLTVIGAHEQRPIADLERDTKLGMNWCSTPEFRSYLLRDLLTVSKADVVALVSDWEESLVVTTVVSFARACGIQVMSVSELLDLLHGAKEN